MKICTKCKVEQPIEAFSCNRSRKDGRHEECRLCNAAAQGERRKNRCPEEKAATERFNFEEGQKAKVIGAKKVCHACKTDKPAMDFYLTRGNKGGLAHECKPCSYARAQTWRLDNRIGERNRPRRRRDYLRDQYDLTEAKLATMLASQAGKCAICEVLLIPGNRGTDALHIDHDHKTGVIRELLCHGCNTALGKFKDSEEVLRRAIEYLKKHKQKTKIEN